MHTHWKMAIMSALLALGSAAASARSWQSGPLSVEVLDARSAPFEQFPASGSGGEVYRAYLKAEKGASYRIHVRNRSGERVGLVIAVDGRNIVSGERSDLKRTEAMYVLEPWADAEYAGWRSNLSSVNEFYFTDWRDSYAEAIGDRSARGVIAVAAFPERVQYRPRPPVEQGYEPRSYDGERGDYSRRDKSEPEAAARSAAQAPAPSLGASADANSARSKSSASEAGTGYGERRWDPARRVEFEAQSAPMAKVFLKYEWAEKLCERGISCDPPRRQRNRLWHEDDYGFVPPPPATRRGW